MAGVWDRCQPSGPWAPTGDSQWTTLTFDRYSASFDSTYRETRLSVVASVAITGWLEPAAFRRLLQRAEYGQLPEEAFVFTVAGNPDMETGDRTEVSSAPLEVTAIDRYGTRRAECHLRWLR